MLRYGTAPRWKLLHYASKRAFQAVSISAFVDNCSHVNVSYSSDLMALAMATLTIETWAWNGSKFYINETRLTISPLSSAVVWQTTIAAITGGMTTAHGVTRLMLAPTTNLTRSAGELEQTTAEPSFLPTSGMILPPTFVDVQLPDPKIVASDFCACNISNGDATPASSSGEMATGSGVCFKLNAKALAVWVQVDTAISGRFSDNGILLVPGETTALSFQPWAGAPPSL